MTLKQLSSLKISGCQRLEPDTIRSHFPLRPGDFYRVSDLDLALRDLLDTGLFAHGSISETANGEVSLCVVENPVIENVRFRGNIEVKSSDIAKIVSIQPRQIVTTRIILSDIFNIAALYRDHGLGEIAVMPSLTFWNNNRVSLIYNIDEHPNYEYLSSDRKPRQLIEDKLSETDQLHGESDIVTRFQVTLEEVSDALHHLFEKANIISGERKEIAATVVNLLSNHDSLRTAGSGSIGISKPRAIDTASADLMRRPSTTDEHAYPVDRRSFQSFDPIKRSLPTDAPLHWRIDKYKGESPPEFIKRAYSPYLGRGLTRADIRHLDPALAQSLTNWLRNNIMPADVDLPTLKEQNSRWVSRIEAEGLSAVLGDGSADFVLREARRLQSAKDRRDRE